MRKLLGVLIKDLLVYVRALLDGENTYLAIRNRTEQLERSPDGTGYRCNWHWTSELHVPKVLPFLGRWLMWRALDDHPVRRLSQPGFISEQPQVSFIIGHRGMARLPHLMATLESIAGQEDAKFECIVVEQEIDSPLSGKLPAWVKHIHTPPPSPDMPYCRSWAFNVAVKEARGRVFVLHDNDMLVPANYAAQVLARVIQGYEVINLKRFIFYLGQEHSQNVFDGKAGLLEGAPQAVVQNLEAGGSVAITREAYERIGGMDESFIGWGGEDNEFWERAQTCKVWSYGYLPIVHLWHPPQPGKHKDENPTLLRYRELSLISPHERIASLLMVDRGDMSGPNCFPGPK